MVGLSRVSSFHSFLAACGCLATSWCSAACLRCVSGFLYEPVVIVMLCEGLLCPLDWFWSKLSPLCWPCLLMDYPLELLPSDCGRARVWLCEPPLRLILGAFGSR